jgi:citrate/tricarballylate utilization protein
MWPAELVREGQHVMTVCNACRYCEGYCPVFQAMEERPVFAREDLSYLANLCHNCGECLYACQYAPPHEFGINVPRTLARIRLVSYEEYCWPAFLSRAFVRQPELAAASLAGSAVILLLLSFVYRSEPAPGAFYAILPHHVMVALFSTVSLFAAAAMTIGAVRFRRDLARDAQPDHPPGTPGRIPRASRSPAVARGVRDALTLRHWHDAGDCTDAEESRAPWRRRFHHLTFYGFALCFASTSVAALYHVGFGWQAPYALGSLPVVLGTAGGLGLIAGPLGLLRLKSVRDPELSADSHRRLDRAFSVLLLLTSATGLLLLIRREEATMPVLLIVHLAFVLALFVMLPYGKFVHGIYRTIALITFAGERAES